jgi:hypothetical protein
MTIPELFKTVSETNPETILPGWCSEAKALTLASIVVALRPDVSLECGVYGGRSLFPMAFAHKAINHGFVIGIDPWSREVGIREQTTDADREWWAKLDYEGLHSGVRAFIAKHQLEQWVEIDRNETRLAKAPNVINLLHIDAGHGECAVHDAVKFGPRVPIGGFCVTDDTNWTGGGVTRAEQRLTEFGFKRICALESGALWQRLR